MDLSHLKLSDFHINHARQLQALLRQVPEVWKKHPLLIHFFKALDQAEFFDCEPYPLRSYPEDINWHPLVFSLSKLSQTSFNQIIRQIADRKKHLFFDSPLETFFTACYLGLAKDRKQSSYTSVYLQGTRDDHKYPVSLDLIEQLSTIRCSSLSSQAYYSDRHISKIKDTPARVCQSLKDGLIKNDVIDNWVYFNPYVKFKHFYRCYLSCRSEFIVRLTKEIIGDIERNHSTMELKSSIVQRAVPAVDAVVIYSEKLKPLIKLAQNVYKKSGYMLYPHTPLGSQPLYQLSETGIAFAVGPKTTPHHIMLNELHNSSYGQLLSRIAHDCYCFVEAEPQLGQQHYLFFCLLSCLASGINPLSLIPTSSMPLISFNPEQSLAKALLELRSPPRPLWKDFALESPY